MSLGKGTSGFSPVSTIGMFAFFISFSTNPAGGEQQGKQQVTLKLGKEVYRFLSLLVGFYFVGWILNKQALLWVRKCDLHHCLFPPVALVGAKSSSDLLRLSSLTQFAIHLFTSSYFVDKLPLEHVHIWI